MLKKITLTLAIIAFAATAFAGTATIAVPAGITFVPSKNVDLGYLPDTLGGTSSVVYAIGSKNNAGDKIFGATSASSAIGFKTGVPGNALVAGDVPAAPTTISDSALAGFSVL
ncbi:MAG: hypothetical protein HXX17_06975 [Geobacteraceae bacterium]|nr:hypothetical protein [Geobacteraceae bacterium]